MQTINIGIDKIDKIFHIADVHVRNVNRHKEYSEVFKRLYTYIRKNKTANSIIYVAGDVVHAKTDMSPELVHMVSDFFKSLADIAPTILITGNHDCNLNNSNRLDALSPIVRALNHSSLHYLKDNDVYEISNVHFNVMSVFEKPANYIKATDFNGKIKIALHHGAVNSATTDLGITLSNTHVTTDLFAGHDLVLLGDIHKMQFLDDKKRIAYPGSLIQQNHGEGLVHGIFEWCLNDFSAKFVEIENTYGYYTFEVENGKILNPSDKVPKKPRIRIKVKDTDSADLKRIISEIRTQYKVQEVAIHKIHSLNSGQAQQKVGFGNIRDVEWQNKIITEYLENEQGLDDQMLDVVRHINRTVHSKLPESEMTRNVVWSPKTFEFSNMFSYGEDNSIDFSNISGVNGLFAPNASGKSTLLDALAFCCFDRCSRTTKAVHVLNNKKTTFTCKLNFELDGRDYYIERRGKKQSNGHVKVDVDFWTIGDSGEEVLLNGEQRDNTNKIIRKYIGSYDDFILTALSLQSNNTGFIDMSQRERKELLTQFLDIDVFELQYQIAAEDIRETSALIREYKRHDYSTILSDAEKTLDQLSAPYERMKQEKLEHDKMVTDLNDIIISLTKEIKTISDDVIDPTVVEKELEDLEIAESDLFDTIKTTKSEWRNWNATIADCDLRIAKFDKQALIDEVQTINNYIKERSDLDSKQQLVAARIDHAKDMVSKLNNHKWDPNCEFCMANPWLQDTQSVAKELPSLETEYDVIDTAKTRLTDLIDQSEAEYDLIKLGQIEDEKSNAVWQTATYDKQLEILKSKSELHVSRKEQANEKLNRCRQHEADLKFNVQKTKEIEEVTSERDDLIIEIKSLEDSILSISGKIQVAEQSKQNAIQSIDRLQELETQYKGFEYYLQAIKRDGVPYQLITKALPQIEAEINNILTQVVDFSMILETDGKNINGYIVYDSDNFWPLELTSGMEKFIASLAIRTSLINTTSLPRPNFLAIDEGFGVLDSENLNNMYLLFDYLKSQFGFVLCISHIDAMRDVVDKLIEIKKVNGYSKINYS
jgi:DNA repair exonuclease SbcCD ATPase subunit/predicted MPP superfamily phosphohydrolase